MVIETTVEVEPIFSRLAEDPVMSEIVDEFVDELPNRVAKIMDCIENADWTQLGRLAHQLKGAGGSYGFPEMTPVAQRLEWTIRQNDPEDILLRAAEDLVGLCRRIRRGP